MKERISIRHLLNGELVEDGKSLSLISLSDPQKPETVLKDGFAMQLASKEVLPVPQMLFSWLT